MKLGLRTALVLAPLAGLPACGYHAAYGGAEPAYRLTVASTALRTPHPEAVQAALAGARAELGRSGALAAGSVHPRLVVEVIRVDEIASGIAAVPAVGGAIPLARAAAIGVTVRGFIEQRPGAEPSRETGDVRRVETVGQGDGDAVSGSIAAVEATRAAARAAGEAVARRVLGIAEPSVAPM